MRDQIENNVFFFLVFFDRYTPGPHTYTRYGDRAFSVSAPKLWTSLPISIHNATSIDCFNPVSSISNILLTFKLSFLIIRWCNKYTSILNKSFFSWEPEGHYHFNDVPLRTRRALLLYKVIGDNALLVLNGISLNSDCFLLVLNGILLNSNNALLLLSWW